MTYLSEIDAQTGLLPSDAMRDKGKDLHAAYQAAHPFPHVAIDNFMPPALLERCLLEFPSVQSAESSYERSQERLKRSFSPDRMSPFARQLFYAFNSRPFIKLIENITGIKSLISDPIFLGGGFHEISEGGHLSVHADFNHHAGLNLERRINVLIYLNKDWTDDYGSQLELWDTNMTRCEKSYVPLFNRCVIFNTNSTSYHGNPTPVHHPRMQPRRSIALYYYTATWDGTKRDHTTQFKVRPGSKDERDTLVQRRELMDDLLPPIVNRGLRRLRLRA